MEVVFTAMNIYSFKKNPAAESLPKVSVIILRPNCQHFSMERLSSKDVKLLAVHFCGLFSGTLFLGRNMLLFIF